MPQSRRIITITFVSEFTGFVIKYLDVADGAPDPVVGHPYVLMQDQGIQASVVGKDVLNNPLDDSSMTLYNTEEIHSDNPSLAKWISQLSDRPF